MSRARSPGTLRILSNASAGAQGRAACYRRPYDVQCGTPRTWSTLQNRLRNSAALPSKRIIIKLLLWGRSLRSALDRYDAERSVLLSDGACVRVLWGMSPLQEL